jgi:hypothetical protein
MITLTLTCWARLGARNLNRGQPAEPTVRHR